MKMKLMLVHFAFIVCLISAQDSSTSSSLIQALRELLNLLSSTANQPKAAKLIDELLSMLLATPQPTHQGRKPRGHPQPTGTCVLTVSGKCVNVAGGGSVSGTPLDIYTCNESAAQNWNVQGDGAIELNDKCMAVANGQTANMTPVQLMDCNGSPAQQWVFLPSGQLKNPHSNRCLDVKDAEIKDGQPLIIYDCKSTDFENQTFESACKSNV